MPIQGNITEVTIVGGEYAGSQAAKTPHSTTGETREFLRHIASSLVQSAYHGPKFRVDDSDGNHQLDRRDVTSVTITFS